jgi:amino acid adenylation domain-containing protein
MTDEDEFLQLLRHWNSTAVEYPTAESLVDLLEATAEVYADEIAVQCGDDKLSYAQLRRKSDALAAYLRSRGAGRDIKIGIALPRSQNLVIAMLAVLKSGSTYVPIDVEYPHDRMSFILQDAQARAVLVDDHLARFSFPQEVDVIRVDAIANAPPSEGPNVSVSIRPEDVAYLIYTSGSTGIPKGVLITHAGICNRLIWMRENFQVNIADRVLQKTSIGFDVSVWEMFLPLISGAILVLAGTADHRDSRRLVELIEKFEITLMHFVPTMLEAFLDEGELWRCHSLRCVFCSGEALTSLQRDKFFELLKSELHNLYGPTECAVDVTWWHCQPNQIGQSVPLGYPIANTVCLILEENGCPSPIGSIGELYIGGVQLAPEYHNRPEETTKRFVISPIPDIAPRLYRTGDLACYRPDGAIEYHGRIDNQIKIRGNRIEPDEIAATACGLASIAQAVCIGCEKANGQVGLALFVVLKPAQRFEPDLVKGYIQSKLPSYMVPEWILLLPSLPYTANGKLDRATLQKILTSHREAKRSSKTRKSGADRNDTENKLFDIWRRVLGQQDIAITDHFLEIGGDSISATRIVALARKLFQKDLNLRDFFAAPTIQSSALLIQSKPALAAIETRASNVSSGDINLTYAQQGTWFEQKLCPESPKYVIAHVLKLTVSLPDDRFHQILQKLVDRHPSLRTVFPVKGGRPVQRILDRAAVDLTIKNLSASLSEEQAWALAVDFAILPMDLESGPLFQNLLLIHSNHALWVFRIHHLVADRWSVEVLINEFAELWNAAAADRADQLSQSSRSMRDVLEFENRSLTAPAFEHRLANCVKCFESFFINHFNLPLDHERPLKPTGRGGRVTLQTPRVIVAAVHQLAKNHRTTPFLFWLTSLHWLLYEWTAQEDQVIGIPLSARTQDDADTIVGMLVKMFPIRAKFHREETFLQALRRMEAEVWDATAYHDIPLQLIVRRLLSNTSRTLRSSPLICVVINFLGKGINLPQISGMDIEWTSIETGTAKFDLNIIIEENFGSLNLIFEYDSAIFERSSIVQLADRYMALLRQIVSCGWQQSCHNDVAVGSISFVRE